MWLGKMPVRESANWGKGQLGERSVREKGKLGMCQLREVPVRGSVSLGTLTCGFPGRNFYSYSFFSDKCKK